MSNETIPPLPDFSGNGNEPQETVYPNRDPWPLVTHIPNPQKPIPGIDQIRPDIKQTAFEDEASKYEGLLSQDETGREENEGLFSLANAFVNQGRLSFTLDSQGVDTVPDPAKIED